ncbi:MAG: 16S rRNA (uracil(1498)-N(3))-methyltransferase [Alphaproteobacteria bacterium]|nr:16S rRNA (uracil(1498)-N(3))-methyltransferase [Alphaproteobacteria bacterium]
MLIRIFIKTALTTGTNVVLDDKQRNYVANVLRLKEKAKLNLFDGQSGEYEAEIIEISKKNCLLKILSKVKDFTPSPDVWILFSPLKKDNTDMVIQKATELGARKIMPVITQRTNAEKVRLERFEAQCIEAAEQCRRTDIPEICPPQKLTDVLHAWPSDRALFFLNESGSGENIIEKMRAHPGKAAILIGPEGGFCEDEIKKVLENPKTCDIFLGNRILRAETAVISALSCWQAVNGDW